MTRQVGPQVFQIVSKYLVSPTGSEGSFTTISGAITQAVSDGAAAATPKVIVIKPGTYTENITLPDGIALVGLDNKPATFQSQFNSFYGAIIEGTITFSSGQASLSNLAVSRTTQNCITHEGGTLNLSNVEFIITNTGVCASLETAATKAIAMNNCSCKSTTGQFLVSDGSEATIRVEVINSFINCTNTTLSGPDGTIILRASNCHFEHNFVINSNNFTSRFHSCRISTNASHAIDTGSSTTGQIIIFNTSFNAAPVFNVQNSSMLISVDASQGTNFENVNFANSQNYASNFYISGQTTADRSDGNSLAGWFFRSNSNGFRNAEAVKSTSYVQTTNATATMIMQLELEDNQGATLFATVSGKRADSGAYCGGNIVGCARRTTGSAILVGTPVKNVMEDSAGSPTFNIDVSGNFVRITVTGIAAETWNWATNVEYQRIETNL